jgi:hypothetical protein
VARLIYEARKGIKTNHDNTSPTSEEEI